VGGGANPRPALTPLRRPAAAVPGTDGGDNRAMFRIVLVHPEIPPNTGNVIRLAANTGCELHLIEPLGFRMDDRQLQRAGLDYHEYATVRCHASWGQFLRDVAPPPERLFAFSTRGSRSLARMPWQAGDALVFGQETAGLPDAVLADFPLAQRVRLPMRPGQRSLNLSNAVAVAVFDAWRCCGYDGGL
jgi:tRNA (cytidine/uridine-2'-O-)-methyltransferase